jgi:hypothetical protein
MKLLIKIKIDHAWREIERARSKIRVARINEIYDKHRAVYSGDCGKDRPELEKLCREEREYEDKLEKIGVPGFGRM